MTQSFSSQIKSDSCLNNNPLVRGVSSCALGKKANSTIVSPLSSSKNSPQSNEIETRDDDENEPNRIMKQSFSSQIKSDSRLNNNPLVRGVSSCAFGKRANSTIVSPLSSSKDAPQSNEVETRDDDENEPMTPKGIRVKNNNEVRVRFNLEK